MDQWADTGCGSQQIILWIHAMFLSSIMHSGWIGPKRWRVCVTCVFLVIPLPCLFFVNDFSTMMVVRFLGVLRLFKARIQHLSGSLPDVGDPETIRSQRFTIKPPGTKFISKPRIQIWIMLSTTGMFLAIYQTEWRMMSCYVTQCADRHIWRRYVSFPWQSP